MFFRKSRRAAASDPSTRYISSEEKAKILVIFRRFQERYHMTPAEYRREKQ